MTRWSWLLFIVFTAFAACSATGGSELSSSSSSATGTGGGGGEGNDFNVGGSGGASVGPAVAFLDGVVLAPEGTIPINEALVYATQGDVEPIPQQVFCDKCIELGAQTPYVLSEVDGTFSLGLPSAGSWKLVIQKGAFRRVRTIDVTEGTAQLDPALTTLPSASDPANGDDIPRMAVTDASWDSIKDTLAKLGLGQIDANGALVAGTEQYDLYDSSNNHTLLTDANLLNQYHIVFFGCDFSWPDTHLVDPTVIDNLRNFVAAGGKLYVTDYSYDILKRAFANENPLTWEYDTGQFGDAESSVYDAPATVQDPDMAAWLATQGITSFDLVDNWTILQSVNNYSANDENGMTAQFTPTVWVTGDVPGLGQRPATVSYQVGCGRALFSTYHTEAFFGATLAAQERALLYIILEVNVCIGDIKPPD